jgi:sucrase/ferredoxin-like protein
VSLCSELARHRRDPMFASASPVRRWLLVEQPGPWGRDALTASRLDGHVAAEMAARMRRTGTRTLLIRRPGRSAGSSRRRWAVVHSAPGEERTWWGSFADDRELLAIPADGSFGELSMDPIYLVCTHGKHDTCCALRGRPVAAALAADYPEATWECSHVGGDRFAANLVLLPHGLYYGFVEAEAALETVKAYEKGAVVPNHLRGRSSLSLPVQAAQHHARAALHENGLNELLPVNAEKLTATTWRVALRPPPDADDALVIVTVRDQPAGEPTRLTCGAPHLAPPRTFALVSIERATPAG